MSCMQEYKVRPYKQQLEGGQEATYYMLSVKGKLFVPKGDGTLVWYAFDIPFDYESECRNEYMHGEYVSLSCVMNVNFCRYHGLVDTVKNLERPLPWKEAWDLHFNPSRNTVKSEQKKTDETPIVRRPPPTPLVKRKLNADASESTRSNPVCSLR